METAIKASRRWGYDVKGVPADQASIVVMAGNQGRTTTIVSFSTDEVAWRGYGPFTPGFRGAVRGHRRRRRRRRRHHRRRDARAGPGRGGRGDPARRLPPAGARAVRRPPRADGRRRGAVGPGPQRPDSPASTRTSSPTSTCAAARHSAAASSRCPRSWPTRRCSGCSSRVARVDVRRQPARRRHRPGGRRAALDGGAAGQRGPARPGAGAGAAGLVGHGVLEVRCRGLWGVDVDPG